MNSDASLHIFHALGVARLGDAGLSRSNQSLLLASVYDRVTNDLRIVYASNHRAINMEMYREPI
jgi:hypothetical protein